MFWWPQEYPLGPHLLQCLRTCKVVHLLLLDIRLVSNQLLLVYNISLYWEKSIGNKRYLCWRFRTLYHIEAPVFFIKEAYRASFKSIYFYKRFRAPIALGLLLLLQWSLRLSPVILQIYYLDIYAFIILRYFVICKYSLITFNFWHLLSNTDYK